MVEEKKDTIYYVVNIPIPNKLANSIHVMNMCSGFVQADKKVVLLIPALTTISSDAIFKKYGTASNFEIIRLPIINLSFFGINKFTFLFHLICFAVSTMVYLLVKKGSAVVYTRGETVLFLALLPKRYKLFFETHIRPTRMKWYQWAMKQCSGVVTVTQYYKNELITKYHVQSDKVVCDPDAVNLSFFNNVPEKHAIQQKLSLPQDKIILVYAGSDKNWKGLDVWKEAVRLLPEKYLAVFVGNIKKDYENDSRFLYVGRCASTEIPNYLSAGDFLILTGNAKHEWSNFYTSPMKMFEYMASKRPIITFDIPAFRDILRENNAFFVSPTEPQSIAESIQSFTKEEGVKKAQKAYEEVKEYTWQKRAKRIADFCFSK